VNINETLAAREKTYGDYEKVALISQVIKDILREGDQYIYLKAYQLECLYTSSSASCPFALANSGAVLNMKSIASFGS